MTAFVNEIRTPTKPGFYYWQGSGLSGREVVVMQISSYKNRSGFHATPLLDSHMSRALSLASDDLTKFGGRWWGPLPQPMGLV